MKKYSTNNLLVTIRSYLHGLKKVNPWAGLLISLICIVLIQGSLSQQPFDDAFITYRYARNISNGLGFVYNYGEKVLGTTTPLFTLLRQNHYNAGQSASQIRAPPFVFNEIHVSSFL